jgi:hypothetical protein
MKYIKLFGLQRTGTNYFYWLINKNLNNVKIFQNEYGWKHGLPNTFTIENNILKEDIIYVFCVRNIISWIYGFRKYKGGNELIGLIHKWNEYNSIALDFINNNNGIYVKHEGLISNPKRVIKRVGNKFNLDILDDIIITSKVMDKGGNITNKEFNSNFYFEKKYLDFFSEGEIKLIESVVDKDLLKKLKYNL